MKKVMLICAFMVGFTTLVRAQTAPVSGEVAAAIKKTIADETDGYFNKNYDQWANAWAHEPYLQWSGNGSEGKILLANGWEEYNKQLSGNFANPKSGQAVKVQRNDYQINIVGDAATATFNQSLQLGDYSGKSREVRVLEKKDNAWKLVYVNSRNTP